MSAHDQNHSTTLAPPRADWPACVRAAVLAIERVTRGRRATSWSALRAAALEALPSEVRTWLLRTLAAQQWLTRDASLPYDILDRACPAALDGPQRELARVVLFGLPAEGTRFDAKQRDAVYQRCCAMILRETRDIASLRAAGQRALGMSEVRGDPALASMLRSFIANREAAIRQQAARDGGDQDTFVDIAFTPYQSRQKRPLAERVNSTLSRLRAQLEEDLATYNVIAARSVLDKLEELRKKYPAFVEREVVDHCARQVATLGQKRFEFREQLADLSREAVLAAKRGDRPRASWIIRRLDAVHKLLPTVLPSDHYATLRDEINAVFDTEERHEAARALVAREQNIGNQIKQLGGVIHRYHKLADDPTTDPQLLARAKTAYCRAVERVREMDSDWLADMMLELDTLLSDLDDPRGRAEQQVNEFIEKVTAALDKLRAQITDAQA